MTDNNKERKFKMPHIYVILFLFGLVAAASTYLIPAGEFDRVEIEEGRTAVDPESFQFTESEPTDLVQFMTAIPRGLIDAGEVVFFTLIIGGMFMVLRESGIIEIAVDKLARRFSNKSILVIPVLMTVFATIATLIGTAELSLVYIPVIIPLIIALGYDSMTAAAIALCGTVVGYSVGVLNPVNTGLAQTISELPTFSGLSFRLILFVIVLTITILFVMRYAKKVQKNPTASIVYEEDSEKRASYKSIADQEPLKANNRQIAGAFTVLIFFIILVWGVITQGWFMIEMAGLFILMGVTVGMVSGMSLTHISESFTEGFRDVLMGAVIIGLARSIAVILEDGRVMDTIVNGLGTVVGDLPPVLAAAGMYFVQLLINFIIPSGSGQALVTMPIMAPLSDMLGVTRQTAVLAFQLGDGFAHILYPTSGYFMAALVIAGVEWHKWIKFFLPLFLILMGISLGALIVAQAIGWS
ncbi:YfcC family protein [Jeotgalicoccus sp. ATCC 8456]|uniref:YfcC family protein n=1 Tax=Jeotgalicoccus sp. ATCC 8456 TaxID=946435 RepID=UPI0018E5D1B8|nr:Na+/H+ antiporter NhaC family protein [Jeotgalicoccus sp. ATCC 8456]QQD84355.1 putative basic amino acid antiporter YfcC [Jeotgalicoccus sp. ATCC 8456]